MRPQGLKPPSWGLNFREHAQERQPSASARGPELMVAAVDACAAICVITVSVALREKGFFGGGVAGAGSGRIGNCLRREDASGSALWVTPAVVCAAGHRLYARADRSGNYTRRALPRDTYLPHFALRTSTRSTLFGRAIGFYDHSGRQYGSCSACLRSREDGGFFLRATFQRRSNRS